MSRDSLRARRGRFLGLGGLTAITLAIPLCGCDGQADSATSGTLTVGATGAGAAVAARAAAVFQQQYPHASIRVVPLDGLRATEALLKGDVGLIVLGRDVVPEERSAAAKVDARLNATPIALDALAVVVNDGNPVQHLALDDLRDMVAGRVRTWSAVGGGEGAVVVITPNPETGTGGSMREVLARSATPSGPVYVLPSDSAVVDDIRRRANGVGVVSASYLESHPDALHGTHLVAISPRRPVTEGSAVAPSQATLVDGTYPLVTTMTAVTSGAPRGVAVGFTSFLASDRGQLIVQRLGFAPVSVAAYEVHLR